MSWAPGTWGSAVGLVLGMATGPRVPRAASLLLLLASFVMAAWIADQAERQLRRHDPPAIIIDEVWGMWWVLTALPWLRHTWAGLVLAFIVFRTFDITKPQPLKELAHEH